MIRTQLEILAVKATLTIVLIIASPAILWVAITGTEDTARKHKYRR